MLMQVLAQATGSGTAVDVAVRHGARAGAYNEWAVLGLLFLIAAGFAAFNVVFSTALGPARKGKVKDTPYESGVNPVGDTHQRFNVRFYLVAMIFLVFDVEVLFLIPWLTIFPRGVFDRFHFAAGASPINYTMLFVSVLVFAAIILVAYLYAWGKGVLKWD
jgi:NADH-quinone oxidoreductase subunit A